MRKPARNHQSTPPASGAGGQSVRIVGGSWRGRRLPFPVVEGLRPTPDRLRETLFNWLQGKLAGATVLDLFAGSGALGLEALSRGATAATVVERHPAAAKQLRESGVNAKDARSVIDAAAAVAILEQGLANERK